MILRFLISGSCYAQSHAFSTHFLRIFLNDLFLLAKLFRTFLVKIVKNLPIFIICCIFHTPNFFSLPVWWKNIRQFPAMGKNQNYWGGGDVSPPPRICSPDPVEHVFEIFAYNQTLEQIGSDFPSSENDYIYYTTLLAVYTSYLIG